MNVDAISPAMSPTTPPPRARTHEDLSKSASTIWFARRSMVCRFFDFSPCGNEKSSALKPAFLKFHRSLPPYNFLTFESVMIAKDFETLSLFSFAGMVLILSIVR